MASCEQLSFPRIPGEHIVAVAWQPAEGTAADPSNAQILVCQSVAISPQSRRIHPRGTMGSQFPKDSEREVAREPVAKLRLHVSARQAEPFLESFTAGVPVEPVPGEVELSWGLQYSRFLTLWRDTGHELEELVDCVVRRVALSGADLGGLLLDVELLAKSYVAPLQPSALSGNTWNGLPLTPEVDFLAFNDGVLRSGLGTTPIREFPTEFELVMEREVTPVFGSHSQPCKLVSEGISTLGGTLSFRPTKGADEIVDRALTDAWESWDFAFTRGSQELKLVLDKVKFAEPALADFAPDRLADMSLPFIFVERADGSVPPASITLKR